ncbi:Scn8a [Symbiodinium necroappetens]|uniref:Scn8a protein n=1 Tax=Symbiodinium necroappetens TaxID=1628268 RepID=A0A812RBR7_9DINO|nr:Scn8a [Symbiodinium necroappetens]
MRSIFLVFFTSEILLRFLFLRAAFFKTAFNVIDFIALLASLVELFSWNLPVDPTLLRLCRLAKLFRTIRVLKVSGMLDSLSLLARCMSSSGLTLVWSLLFLLVIQLIAAMIVCFMVRPYLEDVNEPEERRQEVYKYYGTFTIAVLTLFEVFFANWAPACRVLVENISEWYSLLFLIYRCGIGFAVINVVNAVFVQQTMQVAKGDEEVLLMEKQKAEEKYLKNVGRIFHTLDTSGDGLLSWAEFEVLLEDKKLKFLLDKLEIAAGDLKTLFDLLDDTGDGEISVEEFLEGITRFKGAAKSLDIGQLLLRSRRLEKGVANLELHLLSEDQKAATKTGRSQSA